MFKKIPHRLVKINRLGQNWVGKENLGVEENNWIEAYVFEEGLDGRGITFEKNGLKRCKREMRRNTEGDFS